jgi:mannose-6-phosphate isomerase-like protein (cupin superfamily)
MTDGTENDHVDVFEVARTSDDFRRVLATGEHLQLVVMTIQPGDEIGMETHHDIDQALLFLDGEGEVVRDGQRAAVSAGHLVLVRAGVEHNVVAGTRTALRLVTAYAPPEHGYGTVHATKADADADHHH